jgi:hypothetical protein
VDAYICGHVRQFDGKLGQGGVVQWLNGNTGSVAQGEGLNQYTAWTVNGDTVTANLVSEGCGVAYSRTFTGRQSSGILRKGPYLLYPDNNTGMTVMWQVWVTSQNATIE